MSGRLHQSWGIAAALWLSACTLEVPFEVARQVPVLAPPGATTGEVPLDLTEEKELWAHRSDVASIRVDRVAVRVLAVGEHNRASQLVLRLSVRPDGACPSGEGDLLLFENVPVILEEGRVVETSGGPTLAGELEHALGASGRFGLVVEVEAGHPVEATLELSAAGAAVVRP